MNMRSNLIITKAGSHSLHMSGWRVSEISTCWSSLTNRT